MIPKWVVLQSWKKLQVIEKKTEKNPFSLIVQIRFSKWCAEVFFKYMGLETLKGFRVLENCSLQQNY